MRRTTITGLALMALAVSAAGTAPVRAEFLYTLKDLGTLGGDAPATAMASTPPARSPDRRTPRSGADHAFLSGPDGGPLKDLGTLRRDRQLRPCRQRLRPGRRRLGHRGQRRGTTRSCRAPTAARSRTSAPSPAGPTASALASTPPARSPESRPPRAARPRVPVGPRRRPAQGPRHPRRGHHQHRLCRQRLRPGRRILGHRAARDPRVPLQRRSDARPQQPHRPRLGLHARVSTWHQRHRLYHRLWDGGRRADARVPADPRARAVRPGAAGDRGRRPAGLRGAAAGPAPRLTPRVTSASTSDQANVPPIATTSGAAASPAWERANICRAGFRPGLGFGGDIRG